MCTAGKNMQNFVYSILQIVAGMSDTSKSSKAPSALTDAQLKVHSGWVNTWQNVIIDLDTYVRDFHARGLKWKQGK
jgi:hypothetical protein